MKTGNKVRGTAVSMYVGVFWGVFVSVMATVGLAAILTWLTMKDRIEEQSVGYFLMGILLISSMVGEIMSATRIKRRWGLVCLITGCSYFLVLLGCTAIFFGGNYEGVGATAVVILVGVIGSVSLGLTKNRYREKRYKKYHPR